MTVREAESILASFIDAGKYSLKSNPRTETVKVVAGTEPKIMKNIQTLTSVTDVTRVAESMVLK